MSSSHPSPDEAGLRARKKAATRLALRRAAVRLAIEHGVDHLTVEAVSEAAGVSTRTFFNYFSSKEEALMADPPPIDVLLREELAGAPAGSPVLPALRAVLHRVAAEKGNQRDEMMARHRLVRECPALVPSHLAALAAHERAVAEAVAEHTGLDVEADMYPALIAAATTTVIRVAFGRWKGSSDQSFDALVDEAFDRLLRGMDQPSPSGAPAPGGRPAATRAPAGADR